MVKEKQLILSHLDKVLWPQEKYTKQDVLDYYEEIASWLLPHLKDRPISLRRFPDGINKEGFFQKNIKEAPSWVKTCRVKHEKKEVNYLLINDVKSLLYAVNLGGIEIHPFFSRKNKLTSPDFLVFDLDPKTASFEKVIKLAQSLHRILEEVDVPNFCKTSGSNGLHIAVPLHAQYSYEEAKFFAKEVAVVLCQREPTISTTQRPISKRKGKVYIDCEQNNFAQTLAAVYSVRAKLGATVSTPLYWEEINKGLSLKAFTIKTVPQRVKKIGDLFAPLLQKKINLQKALKILHSL